MIKAFYTGTTGAIEHQKKMSVISNNLANVNTVGYKNSRLTFQELLYYNMRMPESYPAENEDREFETDEEQTKFNEQIYHENKLKVGTGARGNESALNMSQGSFYTTDAPFDVMISGQGFFAVEGYDGGYFYTREGAFRASFEDDEIYLTYGDGGYVLDGNYDRIMLPSADDSLTLIPSYESTNDPNHVQVGVFICPNVYGLRLVGNNRFMPTDFSGEMEEAIGGVSLTQRGLEGSNTDMAEEMVRVIEAQRAFQSNLTVIRTADEIEAYTNQMRG